MARFYPVYARRSDGKQEVVAKGKRKELNQPTDDQLDQKPDKNGIADFYREVQPDEQKHVDWRRKLGGMLARELQHKDKSGADSGYILVALPENYRLYEHVKKTERDGKTEVKSKTHTGGQNDRQDAYLYGHPAGRRKRFRSPNDFFPHLLWLCTDESGDPDNCSCKICTPEELENIVPGAKIKAEKQVKNEADSSAAMTRSASGQGIKAAPQAQRPTSAQPLQLAPTPLPAARTADQTLDRKYGQFMYRAGELVWFSRGQAWGIGVVTRRWSNMNTLYYSIQPLSYPGNHPQITVKQGHAEIRPWLAWSVPRFLNAGLNDQPNPPRYENADWQGIMQRKYGNGDLEVDGSIMAAKMVDASYTLVGKNSTGRPEANVVENHYDGIFLGAEKIWCGESVRLTIGSGTDIMVVTAIVERQRTSSVNQQLAQQTAYLVGDVYSLVTIQHANPGLPTPADVNPHLPERMTRDIQARNAVSIKAKRVASYWKLMRPQHRVDLNDVKGRWYEASIIMPILQPQQWQAACAKGEIQEASLWMNSRGDCVNSNRKENLPRLPRENNRRETRRDAFGQSVPPNTKIEDGVQPPMPANVDPGLDSSQPIDIDPRFDTADDSGNHVEDTGTTGLEEFMDLDSIGTDAMSGFGQNYGAHDPNNGFF
ncbi:Putative cryptic loci regulator 2 [Septoria linicola]|uniref:Cryptic loci regulator 2 n=1 Tax=Septoria linicola TaxID=215465 RepID=A0A9Q9EQC8_9PEZI|nr:putative cryptic loci regulator 2 [Septoria linicola]USW57408.1 Putative cryptic loci regulator 2 [Septoria linicola]